MAAPISVKSKDQLLGDMVRTISNQTDITDFKAGGGLVSLMEAIATRQFQFQTEILKIIETSDVDNLVGSRLDDLAASILLPNSTGGVGRKPALPASGSVTIGSNFKKVATRFYQGKPPAFAGSTILYLQDASAFSNPSSSPKVYLGRNTLDNFEGPIQYTALTNNGSFWTLTLSSPLTKNHSYSDEIVLAQGGNRIVPASTSVIIQAKDGQAQINFTTTTSVSLFDGEAETSASVGCALSGTIGNAATNAINSFVTVPFTGATVANSTAFVDGRDTESDADLRQRIKDYPATLSRGTEASIRAALDGLVDPVSNKAITSASLIRPTTSGDPTTIYIDDGSGLEPTFGYQDYELLLAKASGQEQSFRTAQVPVTPVLVTGSVTAPFDLSAASTITILVDGVTIALQVNTANYSDIRAATAYEVVRDLNTQSALLAWRTVNSGKQVTVFDANNDAEEIEVTSGVLQQALGLPTITTRNIYLYVNGVLNSFKGKTAAVTTDTYPWVGMTNPINSCQVFIDQVTTPVTFSITDADFSPNTVANATLTQWAAVLRKKIPGVSIVVVENRLLIASNLLRSPDSRIQVAGGLVGSGKMFAVAQSSTGATRDYEFNRFTGDIRFVDKVPTSSVVEIASTKTRAFVSSQVASTGTFDLTPSSQFGVGQMLVVTDSATTIRAMGIATSLTATNLSNNLCRLTDASASLFANVQAGDYMYFVNNVLANATLARTSDGLYLVRAQTATTITVEASDAQITAFTVGGIVYSTGMIQAFSCEKAPEIAVIKSSVTGQTSIAQLAKALNDQAIAFAVDTVGGQQLRLRTRAFSPTSTVSVVGLVGPLASVFTLTVAEPITLQSHVGFSSSPFSDMGLPVVTSVITDRATAFLKITPDLTDVTTNTEPFDVNPNPVIVQDALVTSYPLGFGELFLAGKAGGQRFRTYNTTGTAPFTGFARGSGGVRFPQTQNTSAGANYYSNYGLRLEDLPITNVDKFVATFDLNTTDKTVSLPLYKSAQIASIPVSPVGGLGDVCQVTFKDPDDLLTLASPNTGRPFFDAFSAYSSFNFNDFRVLSKSVGVYLPAGLLSTVGFAIRSKTFGGHNRIRFATNLPTSANQSTIQVSHSNSYNGDVNTSLVVSMASDAQVPNALVASGNVQLKSLSLVNSVRTMVLSTETVASPAFTQLGTYTFNTATAGTNQNGSFLKIVNNQKSPSSPIVVTDVPGLPWTVEVQLNGTTPSLATTQALSSIFVNFPATTGTGTLALQPSDPSYNPGSQAFSVIPTATGSLQFQGILPNTLQNGWTIIITSTGAPTVGTPTFTGSPTAWTLDLKNNTLDQTALQALINGNPSFSSKIQIFGTGTISPAQVPSPVTLTMIAGLDPYNLKQVLNGTDLSNGAFDTAAFQVGNILNIGGPVTSGNLIPVGSFPITAKSSGQLTIKVPNYTGLYASGTFTNMSASGFPISSFPLLSKTWAEYATAVNDYQPASLLAAAEALGATSTVFTDPTYITTPNTGSLPATVTTVAQSLNFHSFECNLAGYASIISYNVATNAVQLLSQTLNPLFPSAAQAPSSLYSAINEAVFIVPSNNATLARWASFSAASTLPLFATVDRLPNDSAIQLSSQGVGSQSAVQAQATYANQFSETILTTASKDNDATTVTVLATQAEALGRHEIVQVTNSMATDSTRPYATAATITTAFNPADDRPWFTAISRVYVDNDAVTTTAPTLVLLRAGQAVNGTEAGEPLQTSDQITTTSLSNGRVRFSLTGAGILAARVGDMLYVPPSRGAYTSPFAADVVCASPTEFTYTPTGNKVVSGAALGGMIPYLGYPVVQVESATSVIVLAPRMVTFASVSLTSGQRRAALFLPSPWAEKNIRTSVHEGAGRAQGLNALTGANCYALLRKIQGNFFSLTLSNTSTSTSSAPVFANDNLVLQNMGVSTDDKIVLGPVFLEANRGDWTLVSHDDKNTMIIHRDLGGAEETLDAAVLWWGVKVNGGTVGQPFYQRPVRILDADSVRIGSKLRIAANAGFGSLAYVGSWAVSDIGYWLPSGATDDRQLAPFTTISLNSPVTTATTTTVIPAGISFQEATATSVFRMVAGFSPSPVDTTKADLFLVPSRRVERMKPDLNTTIIGIGKLGFATEPQTGVDGYKVFSGLVQEAHKTIDGFPPSPTQYPGIKAAGTSVSILPPLLKSLAMTLKIRTRDGISINVVADIVRSSVSSYVLDQAVGQAIVISSIVSLVSDIAGVASVEVTATTPTAVDGYIPLADSEKAVVLNSQTDIGIEG